MGVCGARTGPRGGSDRGGRSQGALLTGPDGVLSKLFWSSLCCGHSPQAPTCRGGSMPLGWTIREVSLDRRKGGTSCGSGHSFSPRRSLRLQLTERPSSSWSRCTDRHRARRVPQPPGLQLGNGPCVRGCDITRRGESRESASISPSLSPLHGGFPVRRTAFQESCHTGRASPSQDFLHALRLGSGRAFWDSVPQMRDDQGWAWGGRPHTHTDHPTARAPGQPG